MAPHRPEKAGGDTGGRPVHAILTLVPALALVLATLIAPTTATAYVHPIALGLESGAADRRLDATAEIHCLALNVYHEARSEPDQGKFAVARVTLNRVESPRYPDSVCKVVWQRGQFSWTRDGRSDRPRERRAWEEALWVATVAYWFNPMSLVGDATHYHAVYVRPFWAKVHRRIGRIGRHIFYQAPPRS